MLGKNKKAATAVSESAPQNTSPQQEVRNFPLFFTDPHVITLDRHAKARVRQDISLDFARRANSIPLTAADIPEAAKYYPLAFTMADPVIPVAIVGLEQDNYFIDAQGKWLERCYVPSYVRKYPFVFMEVPSSDQWTLCIDEPALAYDAKAKGNALYEDGKPSALTNNALQFCVAYQEQHRFARQFCDALKQKELLSPQRSDISLANGKKFQLGGFQLIDMEKLKSLPDADVLDWFKRGYLALLYYVMQSTSNWQRLLDLANIQNPDTDNKDNLLKTNF